MDYNPKSIRRDIIARPKGVVDLRLGVITELFICGVDEAGRGPLAGPVVAAAVILSKGFDYAGLDDSKRLSPAARDRQRQRIIASESHWGIGMVDAETIDKINILQATFEAMRIAIKSLGAIPELVLVDGNHKIPDLDFKQRAVIGGDSSEPAISAASILAKTHRDDLMLKYAELYPEYGFEKHKGYGTAEHIAKIFEYGPCPIHRKSFNPISNYYLEIN